MRHFQIIREWLQRCKLRLQVASSQLVIMSAALASKLSMYLR